MFSLTHLLTHSLSYSLTHPARRPRGQIATFLLLGLVAVLVFVIATANLGHLSLTTIKASNAADSSALLLGSQLATKANQEWQTLGQRIEKCKRTGMLGVVLAIVLAVLAVALCPVTACTSLGMFMLVGAVAGAIGGAIGGAIAGTGALQGAIQGAMIGAAIGGGASAIGGGPVAGPGGTEVGFLGMEELGTLTLGAGEAIPAGATVVGGSVTTGIVSVPGAVAGGTMAAGSSIYSGAIQEQMTSDGFTVAAKGISGLPERDQIRESVFLSALSQTVNDPNKTDNTTTTDRIEGACFWPTPVDEVGKVVVPGDPNDADADGNKTESIPCFEYWWDQRITKLKEQMPQLQADVEAFLNGPMSTFEAQAEATYGGGGSRCGDSVCDFDENCGWASQCPADCGSCGGGGD